MKATLPSGALAPIPNCYIKIPIFNNKIITMNILPDISDSKSATYPDEVGPGRSMPFKQYQSSDTRTISWTCHFMVCQEGDQNTIMQTLRVFEACTYPMNNVSGVPYAPPPICKLRCGNLLSVSDNGINELCAVLKSYNVKFDTTVPWDEDTYTPYKLDVDLQFEVVYNQNNLPGAEQIVSYGV